MTDDPVVVDGETLTLAAVERVARAGAPVSVPESARERVRESRERIVDIVDSGQAVYGVNTGFGELVQERIPEGDIETLQQNLVRSHAAGTGDELERSEVRAMLVTRLNALVKGYSGVRERIVDLLVGMLNNGVHPVVRAKGSLGASGDLAPLAHLALVLIGEGEATVGDDRLPGDEALARAELEPVTLRAKEGLGIINGTQLTVGLAALVVRDAERAMRAADIAGAMTTEATMSTTASSHPSIQNVRPHRGQTESAENIRRLTRDSEIVESHRNCDRVQDAYSLRCLPQVHGAVRDSIQHLREAVETELNSATDNPLVFPADEADDRASGTDRAAVLSGGNFHGQPLALRLDYVTSALAELASISERRMDRMLNPNVQEAHLPPFLTEGSGLRSGYMIAQYTAADLVSTNRSQGRPSTDSIPVSGNQEDHVSMSAQSAHIARETVSSTLRVVGIELLCAAQALDFVAELDPGIGTHAAYRTVREHVSHLDEDRPLHGDIDRMLALLRSDQLFENVETAIDAGLA
ncbi:histidine ammonia-lyase [Natrialba aegyptia]|uniref:Probable histidine ammonia-lyase n=1 Tax=Natrialba aegyptia DSM 13077 TaxID=1227491 RepID=M0AKA8_9EURY|nr:histidine ammonia-lyase [Natrialba aegyptia]ELY98959.1 histidine ammonia-lyase [Natrialba aegyptia DSM 13077]